MFRLQSWRKAARNVALFSFQITQVCAAVPRTVSFGTTVGPDGPWNAIIQSVSWPEKNVTLLPSRTKSNLITSEAACSGQNNYCPVPQANLWSGVLGEWSWMNSTPFHGPIWDTSVEPLNLTGEATLISDRVTLHASGQSTAYLDFIANTIDHSYKVNYPSTNTWYSLDTGFFSLYGASPHINYTSVNGSEVSLNTTLAVAYTRDVIPSISYGLHVGSGSTKTPVSGSLVLGGYDRSRCLTQPIVSTNDTFVLTDIRIGVAEGGSPFSGGKSLPVSGLLRQNGNTAKQLHVLPNPGVPYLNLPPDTCSAIAEILPVHFEEDLGLYIWNTSDPKFEAILSSPSYLSFIFSSSPRDTNTIHVPFALLNLTLENPLVSTATQYFPCSPYSPSDDTTYHLGRSFLQAAFLAQNWQTGRTMLAQAPGPDGADGESVVNIYSNDTSISPMANAPPWNATWTSKLKALPTGSSDDPAPAPRKLATGAVAGVVVGVVALLAVIAAVFMFWRRRTTAASRADEKDAEIDQIPISFYPAAKTYEMADTWLPGQHGTSSWPVEVEGTQIRELDGVSIHEKPVR